jgi:hypothetical protein
MLEERLEISVVVAPDRQTTAAPKSRKENRKNYLGGIADGKRSHG